jgi:hypothetical protein
MALRVWAGTTSKEIEFEPWTYPAAEAITPMLKLVADWTTGALQDTGFPDVELRTPPEVDQRYVATGLLPSLAVTDAVTRLVPPLLTEVGFALRETLRDLGGAIETVKLTENEGGKFGWVTDCVVMNSVEPSQLSRLTVPRTYQVPVWSGGNLSSTGEPAHMFALETLTTEL